MKTRTLVAACLGLLLPAASALAQVWAEEPAWEIRDYRFDDGRLYSARLSLGQLMASPDLDTAAPRLPKPLGQIVEAALPALEKACGTRQGWTVSEVKLMQPQRLTPKRKTELAKKWFYLVYFRSESSNSVPYVAVTIDGRPCVVTTAKDAARQPRLPFN